MELLFQLRLFQAELDEFWRIIDSKKKSAASVYVSICIPLYPHFGEQISVEPFTKVHSFALQWAPHLALEPQGGSTKTRMGRANPILRRAASCTGGCTGDAVNEFVDAWNTRPLCPRPHRNQGKKTRGGSNSSKPSGCKGCEYQSVA